MKEAKGDMFFVECDALVVTTNGYVKTTGECVMGRGCAKQAAKIDPEIPRLLGTQIRKHGNNVNIICERNGVTLVSYPVKPSSVVYDGTNVVRHIRQKLKRGQSIGGWAAVANKELIERSASQLVKLANERAWNNIILPRPGCGAGELDWADIGKMLHGVLDDRFTCMTF